MYDFNSLPLALKVHLVEEDITVLEQLPNTFSGSSSQLLAELKGLIDALIHVETHLIKEFNEQGQVRMTDELMEGLIVTCNSYCFRNH